MATNPNVVQGDLIVNGNLSAAGMNVPSGAVGNSQVAANAGIASAKVVGARSIPEQLFADAVTITAFTQNLTTIVGANGSLIDFKAWITTVATGADRTVSVDLQKSTGGGGFVTVLSAPIQFTNLSAVKTLVAGAISSAAVVAGDLLRVVVTVAGSASAQALGLSVVLRHDETYV